MPAIAGVKLGRSTSASSCSWLVSSDSASFGMKTDLFAVLAFMVDISIRGEIILRLDHCETESAQPIDNAFADRTGADCRRAGFAVDNAGFHSG